jgi:hypothetical protein
VSDEEVPVAKFRSTVQRSLALVVLAASLLLAGPPAAASPAAAGLPPQTPVEVSPDSTGMPGAEFVQQALGWLSQLALWGSLASILVGAAVYGLAQNSGNYNGAFRGKQLAGAGAVGACLAGLAPTAVNMLFGAAS